MAQKKKRGTKRNSSPMPGDFYKVKLAEEKESSAFNTEYNMILKTVIAVNSFRFIYKIYRSESHGGPSTHDEQDLLRAMLIFACAGLDAFVKQLVKTKLPQLIVHDEKAQRGFKEYVRRGLEKDNAGILNAVALALINQNPRDVFLNEYVESLVGDSLQSEPQLKRVSEASGLDTKKILSKEKIESLHEVFKVRNLIIHEMDLNMEVVAPKTTGYRTRIQRQAPLMEKYTRTILDLAQQLFSAYKSKYQEYKIGTEKAKVEVGK